MAKTPVLASVWKQAPHAKVYYTKRYAARPPNGDPCVFRCHRCGAETLTTFARWRSLRVAHVACGRLPKRRNAWRLSVPCA